MGEKIIPYGETQSVEFGMNEPIDENSKSTRKKKVDVISNEEYELIIPGYPKGSNITLLNATYVREIREEGKVISKDYILIVFKDVDSGEKKTYAIYEPLYTFYKLKDGYNLDHNLLFIEKEKVEPITCKYSDIQKVIAEITGNIEFFYDNIRNKNRGLNDKLHMIPDIFLSDMDIENYYRFLFSRSYVNEPYKLNKAFLDIETDGRYALGDFPQMGEVPINAVAYLDKSNNKVYQFLLNNPANPLIEKYKLSYNDPNQMKKLKDFIIESVGGYKKANKFGVDKFDYVLLFFDDELEMIKALFSLINKTIPDFLLIWNMAFDLNYIIQRIINLNGIPEEIICDPRIKQKFLRFHVDERNINEFAERGDYVGLTSYTVWLDQMIQFASRRKGRGQYASFRLDAIGEDIAHVNKLDYSHITTDINMLPYLDYETFSFYNIMDVIVQNCIESVTQDVEYTFTKCNVNNTKYSKCHRQSVYLGNRFAKDFYEYGFIIGNNKNRGNERPNIQFVGAAVGNPKNNSIYAYIWVNGRPTLLADSLIDFD